MLCVPVEEFVVFTVQEFNSSATPTSWLYVWVQMFILALTGAYFSTKSSKEVAVEELLHPFLLGLLGAVHLETNAPPAELRPTAQSSSTSNDLASEPWAFPPHPKVADGVIVPKRDSVFQYPRNIAGLRPTDFDFDTIKSTLLLNSFKSPSPAETKICP